MILQDVMKHVGEKFQDHVFSTMFFDQPFVSFITPLGNISFQDEGYYMFVSDVTRSLF